MGHSTASGRNAEELHNTFREATAAREATRARNSEIRRMEDAIGDRGYAEYKGYDIERGAYGGNDVTV